MRRHFALITLLTVFAAPFLGCTPGDDADHVMFAQEYEPNDTSVTASPLGPSGIYAFQGNCVGETNDWFEAMAGEGIIEVSMHVTTSVPGGGEEDLFAPALAPALPARLSVRSASQSILAEATEVTPQQPADITGPAAAPGQIFIEIGCPSLGTDGLPLYYFGSVVVP